MVIVAIDPGPEESAMVLLDDGVPKKAVIVPNGEALSLLHPRPNTFDSLLHGILRPDATLAIEMIASYGMPVGREVFETCLWIGRFIERWDGPHELVYRQQVKLHLCSSARAKDPNVRQALIDRFGPGKEKAIGKKATPGPLYGFKSHMWAALAVACTFHDQHRAQAA